jgi:hypothetical protein
VISPALFLRSPLARHPWLLARKIASRLGVRRHRIRNTTAHGPLSAVAYPGGWREALAAGTSRETGALTERTARPFGRVFGRDFPEALLLELCRTGPRRGDTDLPGDIKLIWDYSRGHPLWANTMLGQVAENAAFIRRWIGASQDLEGPAWTCAMDVALRAINWTWADVMAEGQIGSQVGAAEWARWLWRHGDVIWQRLEARINSNNHYLADLLGLAVVGAIFPGDCAARRWRAFAEGEFPHALLAQTRVDGGLNEASLRYHAFVTEMALFTRLALGAPFPHPAEHRLRQMCQIVSDFREASGDLFALGDDDSGRVLDLEWAGAGRVETALRLATSQLGQRFEPNRTGLYPASGWWSERAGEFVLAFEFGGVGLNGFGSHAHNDDFSFCLEWRSHPVIVDPGTYLYTSDPAARNSFRSVLAHNTVCLDGREQRPLTGEMFHLPGSDQAATSESTGPGGRVFRRQAAPGVFHRRAIQLSHDGLELQDWLDGTGRSTVEWRFHLHPKVEARARPTGFSLHLPGRGTLELILVTPGHNPQIEVQAGRYSAGYGRVEPTSICHVKLEGNLPLAQPWRIRPID